MLISLPSVHKLMWLVVTYVMGWLTQTYYMPSPRALYDQSCYVWRNVAVAARLDVTSWGLCVRFFIMCIAVEGCSAEFWFHIGKCTISSRQWFSMFVTRRIATTSRSTLIGHHDGRCKSESSHATITVAILDETCWEPQMLVSSVQVEKKFTKNMRSCQWIEVVHSNMPRLSLQIKLKFIICAITCQMECVTMAEAVRLWTVGADRLCLIDITTKKCVTYMPFVDCSS